MGAFKRTAEKVKQALGFKAGSDKEWKPTSNDRNNMMVKEAKKFAVHIKNLHKDISSWIKSIDAGITTVKSVLEAPLPRAYQETVMGVEPMDPTEHIVGQNVQCEALPQSATEMKTKMQEEVLKPIEQWLAAYRTVKEYNKKLDILRLDLDTKRRAALELTAKFNKLQSKDKPDSEASQAALHKAQNEEDKMNRLIQRYAESETEVFNALITLIRDTTVLREYVAAALMIMQNVFRVSLNAFDLQSAVRTPMLPSIASVPEVKGMQQGSMLRSPTVSSGGPLATPSLMQGTRSMRASFSALPTSSIMGGGGGTNNGGSYMSSVGGGTFSAGGNRTSPGEGKGNPFGSPGNTLKASENPFGAAAGYGATSSGSPNHSGPQTSIHSSSTNTVGAAPAWYNKARAEASRAPIRYDDSDDENSNPFK
ncbi:hypothetical protein CEUSTIGMA_g7665.t1 [Chlamydomonas eustigma]|uniref:BAR domain-containing protein n=1 Tax=Chlamydomonas eustigma TaxID=1157962 RepID=A0A250XAX2_9CHLO|nr:hypothetical protein CEUSTIGMA_g7665.t1 [Chlamydomonas eustigma]|eukprot:GAX80227.1 hypothetical protein CEUSTIGMA_g7665.t1 [Chlamydomonas eustigma]